MKLKIREQLLVWILSAVLLTNIITVIYTRGKSNDFNRSASLENLKLSTELSSKAIEKEISLGYSSLQSLAYTFSGTNLLEESKRVELYKLTAEQFLNDYSIFTNFSISWELKNLDNTYIKNYGRKVYSYSRHDGGVESKIEDLNLDGDDFNSLYFKVKTTGVPIISGLKTEKSAIAGIEPVLKTSIYIPVFLQDTRLAAVISADVNFDTYTKMIKDHINFGACTGFLLTDGFELSGFWSSSSENVDQSFFMRSVKDSSFVISQEINKAGVSFLEIKDSSDVHFICCTSTIKDGFSKNPWFYIAVVPDSFFANQALGIIWGAVLISILGLILVIVVINIVSKNFGDFISQTIEVIDDLSKGHFKNKYDIKINSSQEIQDIANSLNNLRSGLKKAVLFAESIEKGNLKTDFKTLSKSDELGSSLLSMRNSLIKAQNDEQKRKEQDSRQNWSTLGVAKFGEILRNFDGNMENFAFNIISNLVKYIGANQGGLFIIHNSDDKEQYFDLMAGYAYNIRKLLKKRIYPGVGLVGRCVLERESIYINNLPEDYINISSGLGEKPPHCLLIVPLVFNNTIFAVAEIASFSEIEDYKQKFVEEVGNSIATTIATVQSTVKTNKLLQELQVRGKELASQEEEMRQNMDAMRRSQEEATRINDEFQQANEAMGAVLMTIDYDNTGKIIDMSMAAQEFFQRSRNTLINTKDPLCEVIYDSEGSDTDEFWIQLRVGRRCSTRKIVKILGREFTLDETFIPVQNYYGKVYKIICMVFDVTKYQQIISAD